MRHIEKLDNKYLFLFNWYLLLFVLPCGMFPIQYYIRTMRNPALSPIPKTVLLLIPVLLLVCRSQEKKVRNIKYAYLLITAGILITAVFLIKNSDQYVNGYLWSLLLHCFKYGVLNSMEKYKARYFVCFPLSYYGMASLSRFLIGNGCY